MPGDWTCGGAALPPHMVEHSLRMYDDFYAHLRLLLERLVARHGRVVVFDLHSYNHMRSGSGAACDDPQLNPEINLGTGSMDRRRWTPIVERWLAEMQRLRLLRPATGCAREREVSSADSCRPGFTNNFQRPSVRWQLK